MTIVGTIPKKIYYLIGNKSTISYSIHNYSNIINKKYEYYNTVVVESLLSAKAVAFKKMCTKLNFPYIEIVKNNVPLNNIQIVNLLRCNGKNKYQVLIGEYLVELQEDVLIDTILSTGIGAEGNINAQFIWVKIGGLLKLIRVGSSLYYSLHESNKKKNIPKIKDKQLEIGGVYRTRNGTTQVFLGNISSTKYIHNGLNNDDHFDYNAIFKKKLMLFAEMPRHYNKQNKTKDLLNVSNEDWDYLDQFWFTTKSNSSFIEKIGSISVPENIIHKIKSYYEYKAIHTLSKYPNSFYASREISHNSIFLNMYPYNVITDKQKLFDTKKYLLFV
jgi:hypothetical protein